VERRSFPPQVGTVKGFQHPTYIKRRKKIKRLKGFGEFLSSFCALLWNAIHA